jgi:hypothetical protein
VLVSFRYERETRTPHSEAYLIYVDDSDQAEGRIDIHFTDSAIRATLAIGELMSEEELQELIGDIDERLVMPADPYREDFVVNVWRGRDGGAYSDDEELEDEDDDEESGNGFRL